MNGKATDADVRSNPDKYDAILAVNGVAHRATGYGGIPNMAFRSESFFGEDRFDLFFWTLQRSGLTKRRDALAALPTQSIRMTARSSRPFVLANQFDCLLNNT
jgi:hypothetical protein